VKTLAVAILLLSPAPVASLHAQPAQPLRDPTLPNVQPEALQQLSDDRIRQKIMQESQAHRRFPFVTDGRTSYAVLD
jgi:hypothetical protein